MSPRTDSSSDAGDPADSASEQPKRGESIGRFVVEGFLGAGAMGIVLAARDPVLERDVALKLVRGDQSDELGDEGRRRLVREARSMAKLSHPNVLTVLEAGIESGRVFLAMERVKGGTLREYFRDRPKASWTEIVAQYAKAGQGLFAAHEKGLVHRDFKADNVLVEGERVLVSDFGLVGTPRALSSRAEDAESRATNAEPTAHEPLLWPSGTVGSSLESRVTIAGRVVGTPAYMAPEQIRGHAVDARSDQFSFCVALYETLFGCLPFRGVTVTEYADSMRRDGVESQPRSQVPRLIIEALERGLSFDPDDRFPSMGELLALLTTDLERSRLGARARLTAMVLLLSSVIVWALVNALLGVAATYFILVSSASAFLVLAFVLAFVVGPDIRAVAFNRKVMGAGCWTIATLLTLSLGCYLLEIPPEKCAAIHLFGIFVWAVACSLFLDFRIAIAAVGYLGAFLLAARDPSIYFEVCAVGHTIGVGTLSWVLADHSSP